MDPAPCVEHPARHVVAEHDAAGDVDAVPERPPGDGGSAAEGMDAAPAVEDVTGDAVAAEDQVPGDVPAVPEGAHRHRLGAAEGMDPAPAVEDVARDTVGSHHD